MADKRSRGFTKKNSGPQSNGNFGWRGAKDSFQSGLESSPFRKKAETPPIEATSKIKPRGAFNHHEEAGDIGDAAYTNNAVFKPNFQGDDAASSGMSGMTPQSGADAPTKLGNININAVNMDKVSINADYSGKAYIGSGTDYLGARSRVSAGPAYAYSAKIKVNRGKESLKAKFDSEIGVKESTVSQSTLESVNQKLSDESINLERLTPNEIQSLAQNGVLNGRRVNLTDAERQTLKAYGNATSRPNSFTTLKGPNVVNSFRKKSSVTEAKEPLKNIRFSNDSSGPIENGRVRVLKDGTMSSQPDAGLSKIKFISSPEERRSQLTSVDKIRFGERSGDLLKRSAEGIKLSNKSIVENFKLGNILLNDRGSKLRIFGHNKQPLGKAALSAGGIGGALTQGVGDSPVAYSKFANALNFTSRVRGIGSGLTGGIMNLIKAPGFGSTSFLSNPIVLIGGAMLLGFSSIFSTFGYVHGTVLPTNNVQYTDNEILGGSEAPDSTLQQVIDELDFKQRAYEYNLIYADKVTKDPKSGRLYIKEGIPDSWHDKIEALDTSKPHAVPDTVWDPIAGVAKVLNMDVHHEDAGAMVTNVYYDNPLKPSGHRIKHFWGPVTCLYPAEKGLETDNVTSDGHLDNRITVWEHIDEYYDSEGNYHPEENIPHEKRMQLFCVGGLYGDGGKYSAYDPAQHVDHSTEAYERLRKKEEGYSTSNAGNKNKINKNISIEYRYEGSKYSYLFTPEKESYYYTSEKVKVNYDTYEFYRAIVSATSAFINNGQENYEYFEEYATQLFEKALDNASITIEPGYEGDAWFKQDTDSSKRLKWDYIDPVGKTYHLNGKKDYWPDGLSKCSSPSYTCKAKIVITIHDAGVQDLLKLDTTNNEKAHAKTFIEEIIQKIKDFFAKILNLNQKGSIRRYLIDKTENVHYNTWLGWYNDDNDKRLFDDVVPFFQSDKIERNTSQMSYAVMLTDWDKTSFNEFFEGLKLPTSSILGDEVEDDDEIEEISGGGEGGGGPMGSVSRPNVKEGGVYLNNLCYINQGQGTLGTLTRYIDDEGHIHTFRQCGCLDSSIMMIYLHYYRQNAESTSEADVINLWKTYFKNNVHNGSGMLETSAVISQLGLTASGANYVKTCGWDKAIDSLYLGNPVLLHIRGYWEYGGRVLHKSTNGHFLVAVGADEDGIYVYDPGNRNNQSQVIPWEAWSQVGDLYYKIYNATGNTVADLSGTPVITDYSDKPEGVLTKSGGVNYYGGRKETYYNMKIWPEGTLVQRAWDSGIEGEYHVSDEGYKMVGDYIILAANFDTYPVGTILNTSLGKGVVVDTGTFAATNPNQIDIAVNW